MSSLLLEDEDVAAGSDLVDDRGCGGYAYGANQCFNCDMGNKLLRIFFSWPSPSGLIDNDGPFLGTWPAAALVGYAIGARLATKKEENIFSS